VNLETAEKRLPLEGVRNPFRINKKKLTLDFIDGQLLFII